MSIARFFNKTVIVRREKTSSGRKTSFVSTATADGHIQKMSTEEERLGGFTYGETYKAWFDLEDNIKKGDRLTDGDGRVFEVESVNEQDYGINQHLEAVMRRFSA